jgi:hypothetical protein
VASTIQVEPDSLTADALDLADSQVSIVPPMAMAPAADPVSQGVAAVLETHSGALTAVVDHSGALRAHGGAVLAQTAARLQATDQDNAATIAAVAGGTAPAATASVAALSVPPAPPDVTVAEIPALTPPPMLPGDQFSALIHGGPGSEGLLDFAEAWQAHAASLDDLADQVLFRGAAIDEHWTDGHQRAGSKTVQHGYWLRESAVRARTSAAAANDVADQFDAAKNATPSPEDFDYARREFLAAQTRRDPIGAAQAAREYTQMQAQAVDAATIYHKGVTDAVNRLATPLQTAPAIANGNAAQAADYHTVKQAPVSPDGDRRQNEIDAFKQVFGREPTSAADWETAAALDPHSYDPKYQGVGPQIKVVKIRPVPDQGVLRVSQWIPQRDVISFPPPNRDFGNDRGPDPHFDPGNTKVTTYIDYENGIVVMRQNPSIEETPDGGPGRVMVGEPQGSVMQATDGSVRIKYDAGNPFAPGIVRDPQGPFAGHAETVNGDLTFTPGAGGVQVGGTRTDYPSMEIYQDLPDGSTHTVLIDPAQSGSSLGPATNLPFHHDVGIGGKAFAPFDRGGWNPTFDVPVPLPSTQFGPVTSRPSVPPLPTGGAVQF